MYADDTPSTIFFLVNGNALEATIPAQGRTAQENEPKNAPNAEAQPELCPFLSDRLTHRIRTYEGAPVRHTTKFHQVPLYVPQFKCAKKQSERVYIAGVMSDCHPMNGSVRLQTHIGSIRTLQVTHPEAPPMRNRVTRGP